MEHCLSLLKNHTELLHLVGLFLSMKLALQSDNCLFHHSLFLLVELKDLLARQIVFLNRAFDLPEFVDIWTERSDLYLPCFNLLLDG